MRTCHRWATTPGAGLSPHLRAAIEHLDATEVGRVSTSTPLMTA